MVLAYRVAVCIAVVEKYLVLMKRPLNSPVRASLVPLASDSALAEPTQSPSTVVVRPRFPQTIKLGPSGLVLDLSVCCDERNLAVSKASLRVG